MGDEKRLDGALLEVWAAREHGLDVDHRCAVDRLDGADPEPVPGDPPHRDAMQAHGIRPIRRARGEDPGQRPGWVRAGMDAKDVPPGPVQPRDHHDVVPRREAAQARRRERAQLEPGVGGALRALLWRVAARLEPGSDHPDRTNLGASPAPQGFHSTEPTTCLVATLRRFQTLMPAIAMTRAASAGSSVVPGGLVLVGHRRLPTRCLEICSRGAGCRQTSRNDRVSLTAEAYMPSPEPSAAGSSCRRPVAILGP
jgi:hypothetical protein